MSSDTDMDFDSSVETITKNKPKNGDKRLSVERIYQKKSQLEHILLRPDTYIGSVETETKVSLYLICFLIKIKIKLILI
jgi:hypothetical protein